MIANKGFHWRWFLFRCSLPFRGSVVVFPTSSVGLWGLLVAGDHAFTWLVTVLASTLSSPGFLYCLARSLRCAALLYLWLCAQSLLCHGIPRILACPSPSNSALVLLVPVGSLLPYGSHPSRWGHPYGSRLVCPRSERRFRVTIWVRCTGQFPGWASNPCLRLLCAPCPSGCVSRWSSLWTGASVVLSSLQCSSLSHVMVTCSPPRPLLRVWGCPWLLTLVPAGWGLSLCQRLLFVPCSRRYLPSWWSSRRLLDLSIVLPWP